MKLNIKKAEIALARACMNERALRDCGISAGTVTRAFNGDEVKPATIGKICKVLGVDPCEIVEGSEKA